jgi:hypothetical protein
VHSVEPLIDIVSVIAFAAVVVVALWWRPRTMVFREGLCSDCGHAIAEGVWPRCPECGSDLAGQHAAVWRRVRARRRCVGIALVAILVAVPVVPWIVQLRWVSQFVHQEMGGRIMLLPIQFAGSRDGWLAPEERESVFNGRPERIKFTAPQAAVTIEREGERWFHVRDGEAMTAEDVGTALRVTDPAFPGLVESLLSDDWKMTKAKFSREELAFMATTPTIFFDSHSWSYPLKPLARCTGIMIAGAALIAIVVVRRRASA